VFRRGGDITKKSSCTGRCGKGGGATAGVVASETGRRAGGAAAGVVASETGRRAGGATAGVDASGRGTRAGGATAGVDASGRGTRAGGAAAAGVDASGRGESGWRKETPCDGPPRCTRCDSRGITNRVGNTPVTAVWVSFTAVVPWTKNNAWGAEPGGVAPDAVVVLFRFDANASVGYG
jgi:hypothetical protein